MGGAMSAQQRGFTLVEVMIACAVVAILTAIAYPSYVNIVQKTRRSDAKSALVGAAGQLERIFTENNSYSGAAFGTSPLLATSLNGYYTLSFGSKTATTYTINATPAGQQVGDACGTFTFTDQGVKDVTGGTKPAADCW